MLIEAHGTKIFSRRVALRCKFEVPRFISHTDNRTTRLQTTHIHTHTHMSVNEQNDAVTAGTSDATTTSWADAKEVATTAATTSTSVATPINKDDNDVAGKEEEKEKDEEKEAEAEADWSTSNVDQVIESFDDMGLREDLLRGIYAYGYEKPSRIQQMAIKPFSSGRDMLGQAQSGMLYHVYCISLSFVY